MKLVPCSKLNIYELEPCHNSSNLLSQSSILLSNSSMPLSRLLKSILDCKTEISYLLLEIFYPVECREISNEREF